MNLGETIYRLRTKQGMSQDALAGALDVSRQSVSKWENNAAVPELEKLIKMSELFGITLDELVGREAPAASVPSAPSAQAVPPYRTVGIVLLGFGLLATLLLSILGSFILGVMAGLPFTLVGCVLIVSTEDHLFQSAWGLFAIYAPLVYYFMLNFMGYGLYIKLGVIGVWFAALIVWAIILHRKGKLSDSSRKLVKQSVILALILTILLSIGTSMYYRRTGLQSASEELAGYAAEPDLLLS